MNVVNQFRRLLKTEALLTIAAIATIAKAIIDVTVLIVSFLSLIFVLSFISLINVGHAWPFFFFCAAKVRTFSEIRIKTMSKNIKIGLFVDCRQ